MKNTPMCLMVIFTSLNFLLQSVSLGQQEKDSLTSRNSPAMEDLLRSLATAKSEMEEIKRGADRLA